MDQDATNINARLSFSANAALLQRPIVDNVPMFRSDIPLDKKDRLRLAVNELQIGNRIHEELKRQGRTVSWLAKQLCMERTSLYYTFRQNSIDMELLLRISFHLEHNFLQDVLDVYKAYGL